MTLPEIFQKELDSLPTGPGLVTASIPPRQVRLDVDCASPLAVRFHKLELITNELVSATSDELMEVAKNLSDRVTYLLEPLGPIEVDDEKCVVQMRSLPPTQNDKKHSYYELLVQRGGSLSLSRYEKSAGNARQPVPADVTREVMQRLVSDFCAAIDGS
ncbi:MAG: hypothetical protein JW829_08420 [Pirellulales bacterium]|nr:hypothetical protein [Pirellulales bacterium]